MKYQYWFALKLLCSCSNAISVAFVAVDTVKGLKGQKGNGSKGSELSYQVPILSGFYIKDFSDIFSMYWRRNIKAVVRQTRRPQTVRQIADG